MAALEDGVIASLLLSFLSDDDAPPAARGTTGRSTYEEDDEEEQRDAPADAAGAMLLAMAAGSTGAEELVRSTTTTGGAEVPHGTPALAVVAAVLRGPRQPRSTELAAGIAANLAVHTPLRPRLRRCHRLLTAAGACFGESMDPQTLSEIARFFSGVLRPSPGDDEEEEEEEEEEEDRSDSSSSSSSSSSNSSTNRSALVAVLRPLLPKVVWVLGNSLDAALLSRTAELLYIMSFYEAPLFRAAAGSPAAAAAGAMDSGASGGGGDGSAITSSGGDGSDSSDGSGRGGLGLAEAAAGLLADGRFDGLLAQAADPLATARALDLVVALSDLLVDDDNEEEGVGEVEQQHDSGERDGTARTGEQDGDASLQKRSRSTDHESIAAAAAAAETMATTKAAPPKACRLVHPGGRPLKEIADALALARPKLTDIVANRDFEYSDAVVSRGNLVLENVDEYDRSAAAETRKRNKTT